MSEQTLFNRVNDVRVLSLRCNDPSLKVFWDAVMMAVTNAEMVLSRHEAIDTAERNLQSTKREQGGTC